jgi:hypothetical protein
MEVIYRWLIVLALIATIVIIGTVVVFIVAGKQQWPEDGPSPRGEVKRRRFNRIVSHRHQ